MKLFVFFFQKSFVLLMISFTWLSTAKVVNNEKNVGNNSPLLQTQTASYMLLSLQEPHSLPKKSATSLSGSLKQSQIARLSLAHLDSQLSISNSATSTRAPLPIHTKRSERPAHRISKRRIVYRPRDNYRFNFYGLRRRSGRQFSRKRSYGLLERTNGLLYSYGR